MHSTTPRHDRYAAHEWYAQHASPVRVGATWATPSTCKRPRRGWLARLLACLGSL